MDSRSAINSGPETETLTRPRDFLGLEWWIFSGLITLFVVALVITGAAVRYDDIAFDKFSRFASSEIDPSILIVAIDDRSLREVGRWPWARETDARLLRQIQLGEPRAVIFDALFAEPQPDDEALASAFRAGAPVVVPLAFAIPGMDGRAYDLIKPTAKLSKAVAGIGHVNVEPSDDGVVRYIRSWDGKPPRLVPHIVVTALRVLNEEVPLRDDVRKRLPFAGPAGTYPTVSAAALLNSEFPEELLKGRIIFVGATASGLGDWHPTSAIGGSGSMSGIELHANLLAAIRQNRLISDTSIVGQIIFTLVPLWILLVAFRFQIPSRVIMTMIGLIGVIIASSIVSLGSFKIWLPFTAPILGLILAYPIWGWRRLVVIHRFLNDEIDLLEYNEKSSNSKSKPEITDQVSRRVNLLRDAIASRRQTERHREMMLQFLSHDMRTPQHLIISTIETAEQHEIEASVRQRILSYSGQTLELADGFVNLARAEAEAYRFEPLNLSDILVEAIDNVWPLLLKSKLRILTSGTNDEHLVYGDGAKLFRVAVNLFVNAVRHSPVGSVITCKIEDIVYNNRNTVIVTVSDEGKGVSELDRGHLFTPFMSGKGQINYINSVGLGLAFVKAVIDRHKGTISYVHGPGANFIIELPMCEAPRNPA